MICTSCNTPIGEADDWARIGELVMCPSCCTPFVVKGDTDACDNWSHWIEPVHVEAEEVDRFMNALAEVSVSTGYAVNALRELRLALRQFFHSAI